MGLVKRMWNGRYGRVARRDIAVDALWRVRWRKGDGDNEWQSREFDDETAAQVFVADLLQPNPRDWRDITPKPQSSTPVPASPPRMQRP